MRYLRKPFDYASTGNYSAPGKPWDATPRLVMPSDSLLANGATPDTAVPAEYENGRNKILSDGQYLQAHAALQGWQGQVIPQVSGSDTYFKVVPMRRNRGFGTMTETQSKMILLGVNSSALHLQQCNSNDLSLLQAVPTVNTAGGMTNPVIGYSAGPDEMVALSNGTLAAYTTNHGAVWSGNTPFSGPPAILGFHYAPGGAAAGYYLINDATNGTGACGRAATIGVIISATLSNIPITAGSKLVASKVELADNGSVILLAGVDNAGNSQVYRSSDGGATWGVSLSSAFIAGQVNVIWSDYYQLFFVWDETNGTIWSSSSGASWASVTTGRTPANGFLAGRGTLQAVGPALVKASNIGGNDAGITYTLDLGATWYYWYFDDGSSGSANPVLTSANNRLYAITNKNVYRSGQLGAPSVAEI